jgi:hypothetical protein
VHHGTRHFAAHQVIALRHGDGDVLVRHGDEFGHVAAVLPVPQDALDDRREIGAAVGEYVANAAGLERRHVGLGDRGRRDLLLFFCIGGHNCVFQFISLLISGPAVMAVCS